MKIYSMLTILFWTITVPVCFAELTPQDLDKIRLIVKDEVNAAIDSSERRMRTYIDIKIDGVEKQIESLEKRMDSLEKRMDSLEKRVGDVEEQIGGIASLEKQMGFLTYMVYALIALIVAAIAIPQLIVTWRSMNNHEQKRINQELREEIEALKRQRAANP